VCPVEVEREFGGGLEKRKAIYLPFRKPFPMASSLIPRPAPGAGMCQGLRSGAIHLDEQEARETIHAGPFSSGLVLSLSQPGEKGIRFRTISKRPVEHPV